MLELISITKAFKGKTVIQDINLKLYAGQVTALVGNSGCGKTTILQIAGLLDNPTSGKVLINQIDCTKTKNKERTRIRRELLSFVYQFHHLLQELSVLENVMLPHLIIGKSKSEAKKNAQKILEKFNLEDKSNNSISRISGGERQRIAIARSLINSPKILLADEPTGNLDPLNALNVFLLLCSYVKENNASMLIVTHNHSLAEKADSILELKKSFL
ncbi:MAG: ABC transporter ATP-binding protein [Wolbachia endosymbiont of Fragariocoptes setiger]|nr:ABC transporter ATP-binding protein [Wolbachia endosymbiont of Fragariocoptes setiger]